MNIDALYSTMRTYADNNHELGSGIQEEDAPRLIEQLIQRLGTSIDDLDMSIPSLERLETLLIGYLIRFGKDRLDLNAEEMLRLTREVAAYIGKVFVSQTPAQWAYVQNNEKLYCTFIAIRYSPKAVYFPNAVRRSYGLWDLAAHSLVEAERGQLGRLVEIVEKERRKPRKRIH